MLPINVPPVPLPDAWSVVHDGELQVGAPGVLANDIDADGDELRAELVTGPAHGDLNLNHDGSFRYRPDAGFTGLDGFTYAADDDTIAVPATVVLTVTNVAPVGHDDSYSTKAGTKLSVDRPGVLKNDDDADGDGLTVDKATQAVARDASTSARAASSTTTPDDGFAGTDSFTYRAFDGADDSAVVLVTIEVVKPKPVATPTPDPGADAAPPSPDADAPVPRPRRRPRPPDARPPTPDRTDPAGPDADAARTTRSPSTPSPSASGSRAARPAARRAGRARAARIPAAAGTGPGSGSSGERRPRGAIGGAADRRRVGLGLARTARPTMAARARRSGSTPAWRRHSTASRGRCRRSRCRSRACSSCSSWASRSSAASRGCRSSGGGSATSTSVPA